MLMVYMADFVTLSLVVVNYCTGSHFLSFYLLKKSPPIPILSIKCASLLRRPLKRRRPATSCTRMRIILAYEASFENTQ